MGTISIRFRVPVVNKFNPEISSAPFMNFRANDNDPPNRWRGCNHRHKTIATAEKCARSMCLGQTHGAVNERIEICGRVRHD